MIPLHLFERRRMPGASSWMLQWTSALRSLSVPVPAGDYWAPFVRGCVPVDIDPGHDTDRLNAVLLAWLGTSSKQITVVQRWPSCSSPEPASGPFCFFQSIKVQ